MTVEREQGLSMALSLTRRALELLDTFHERAPAILLQHAIDKMTDAPTPRTDQEAEAILDSPEGRALQERLGWSSGGAGAGG